MSRPTVVRKVWRAVPAFLLVAFLVLAANASLFGRQHLLDVRLPLLSIGVLAASPGWLILVLGARTRGAPWRWLAVAAAWGAFAAAFVAFLGEEWLAPLANELMAALEPLGRAVAGEVPGTLIAPVVEEPAKAVGVLIALAGVRRAGTHLSVALGAAVGGLVGLAFGIAEATHHVAELVADVGYVDLDGVFVINWDAIWRVGELQLVQRLFLGGLTNHALFSALAGVAVVALLRGRRLAAVAWFLAALFAHALYNSIGSGVREWIFSALGLTGGGAPPLVPGALVAWLAAATSFLVAEGWAVAVLVRGGRRDAPDNAPPSSAPTWAAEP